MYFDLTASSYLSSRSDLSLVPDLSGYFDVLKSDNVKLYAVLLMMVTGPYTAYDSLLRNSMASSAIRDPNNMHNLFLTLGLTTLFVNLILLPKLQTMISTQALLSGSFSVLAGSYLYLAVFHDLIHLFIGMPVQVSRDFAKFEVVTRVVKAPHFGFSLRRSTKMRGELRRRFLN